MLLMATLYYDIFAKDASMPQLSIIPHSPSADLVTLFLKHGADPNFRIPNALKDYGNITGEYSAWEVHLREPDRTSKTWDVISVLFLEHGADPESASSSASVPQKIVALAQQKVRDRRDEMRRQKRKSLGLIFKVKHFRIKKQP